jgi:electron transport complex protein RnfE
MNSVKERLVNGIVKENPTFVLMLGMCPTLAVTTSAVNGLGMGLTTMVVLALSNVFISMLRHIIPDKVRIPAFIVIIASFVTMVELLLQGFIPFLYDALGIYIPLIVVNCIILGRAEAYAYKNPVIPSLFDGIGMGLGFSVALTCIGAVRELLGAGTLFGIGVMPESFVPVSIFIMAPGAFFVLAVLTAIQNKVKIIGERKGKDMSKIQSGCGNDCLNCSDTGCAKRLVDEKERTEGKAADKAQAARAETVKEADKKPKKVRKEIEIEEIVEETGEEDMKND